MPQIEMIILSKTRKISQRSVMANVCFILTINHIVMCFSLSTDRLS